MARIRALRGARRRRALFSNEAGQGSAPIAHAAARTDEPVREGIVAGLEPFVDTLCVCTITALVILLSGVWNRPPDVPFAPGKTPGVVALASGEWSLEPTLLPPRPDGSWEDGEEVFVVIDAELHPRRGSTRHRLGGTVEIDPGEPDGGRATVHWQTHASTTPPTLASDGLFYELKGATLTAKAFDRVLPGLGFLLVPMMAWLFALSTMISWSYYGEQGVVYLLGERAVTAYRLFYCAMVFVACTPLIHTEAELDVISTLGTGVMLFANIPIMLIFGRQTMRAYRLYVRRLKAGDFDRV